MVVQFFVAYCFGLVPVVQCASPATSTTEDPAGVLRDVAMSCLVAVRTSQSWRAGAARLESVGAAVGEVPGIRVFYY